MTLLFEVKKWCVPDSELEENRYGCCFLISGYLYLSVVSFSFLSYLQANNSLESSNRLTARLSLWLYIGPAMGWSSYSCGPALAMKTSSFGQCMWIKACMLSANEGSLRVKCWLLAISHPTRVLLAPTLYPSLTWCQSCRSSNLCIHYTRPDRLI